MPLPVRNFIILFGKGVSKVENVRAAVCVAPPPVISILVFIETAC